MAVSEAKHPQTIDTITDTDDNDWSPLTPVDLLKLSDNARIQCDAEKNEVTDILRCTNFDFTTSRDIPTGSTIDGIKLFLEASVTPGSLLFVTTDLVIRLRKFFFGQVGDNKALTGLTYAPRDEMRIYGGEVDLWGTTWSVANVTSSSFGVDIQFDNFNILGGGNTNRVDQVKIQIFFTPPSQTTNIPMSDFHVQSDQIQRWKFNPLEYKRSFDSKTWLELRD
jgi:hypothetical protein